MRENLLFTNSLKMEFLDGSYSALTSRWRTDRLACPFVRLYYIYAGGGEVTCAGQTIPMVPGNLYLLPRDVPISYHCNGTMEQLFFHVCLVTLEGVDILANIKKVCCLPCSREHLDRLKGLYNAKDYCDLLEFKMLVMQDIVTCFRSVDLPPVATKTYSRDVLQAIYYMQDNANMQLTTKQISQAISTSPNRLHKLFKAETGITIGAYLDNLVFLQAAKLLMDRELPIGEISRQLGFCDQYYFSRRFKEQFGKTPSEFRKQRDS